MFIAFAKAIVLFKVRIRNRGREKTHPRLPEVQCALAVTRQHSCTYTGEGRALTITHDESREAVPSKWRDSCSLTVRLVYCKQKDEHIKGEASFIGNYNAFKREGVSTRLSR